MSADERKKRPQGENLYIDEQERISLLERMTAIKALKKQEQIAEECGVTSSAITLLLKRPIPKGKTRGCKFLGKLQRALGLEDTTTKRRAMVVLKETQRRVEHILREIGDDNEGLQHWLSTGELIAKRGGDK